MAKTMEEKFDDFLKQYQIDMHGDNNAGEDGKLGVVDFMREIGRVQRDYPSLTWLFAHKPIPTTAVVVGVFLILYGSLALGVIKMAGSFIGLDTSSIPNTH